MIQYPYYFLIFFLITFSFQAQEDSTIKSFNTVEDFEIPDSLSNQSLTDLKKKYYLNIKNPARAELYIKSYLKKSAADNNTINIARGYLLLSRVITDVSLKLTYIDKSIVYAAHQDDKNYPALSYLEKGNVFFNNGNYGKTLDNYFIAFDIAEKSNPKLSTDIKFNIGLLKSRIGKNTEALKIFKDCHTLYEKEKETNILGYLRSLFAISDSYTRLNKLDSASTLNTYGVKQAIMHNNNAMYHYFVMNEGVNLFFKKEYNRSIDSLLKVTPFLLKVEDHSNLIFSRLYLGKSYIASKQTENGLNQFKIVDTLLKNQIDFAPETREIYKTLINYYKTTEDKEKQLFYHDRLSTYDSILYANYKNIKDQIIVDFDTPLILKEKEKTITQLNTFYTNKVRWGLVILVFLVTFSIVLIYRNRLLKKRYENKFEELIRKKHDPLYAKSKTTDTFIKSKDLSEDIVLKIEKKLNVFISKKEYLNKNVSLSSLAKNIDSNTKYLSQYINHYEKKKFTDYLNDLRIDYTIEKIKTDKKFRMYTIKAISESVGFSNPISFSKAFYKKTGIKPSYFIKKVEHTKNK